ncbi:hypothetical protein E4T44_02933 [Aureobasidium sp. EXF-8845]|nr:hypothetical protein E4T44_02933 [Aureobasidium sp. EXF-8845]KAI4855612.1 hypothetical protein E4T45_02944 [Aureobasidium sp. EXF-8846]
MDNSCLLEGSGDPPARSPGAISRYPSNNSLPRLDTDSGYTHNTQKQQQPNLMPLQPSIQQSLPTRFQPPTFSSQNFNPQLPPYHQQRSFGQLPPITTQDQRLSPPPVNGYTANGPVNKRLAPSGPRPSESPAKKKQSKWGPEEDATIVELRGNGLKWEDISKHLPGRSAISCRLRFQNYLERRSEWDDEKKIKLARLYERFKKDMWEKIAKEMALPWRAAEAMHWQIGEVGMASRANVPVFHLAGSASQSQSQSLTNASRAQHYYSASSSTSASAGSGEPRSNITSPTSAHSHYQLPYTFAQQTHNHTLQQMVQPQPLSPGSARSHRTSAASLNGADVRNRADSVRDSVIPQPRSALEPNRQQNQKRYVPLFADMVSDNELN